LLGAGDDKAKGKNKPLYKLQQKNAKDNIKNITGRFFLALFICVFLLFSGNINLFIFSVKRQERIVLR
jgi:hypothetical protein